MFDRDETDNIDERWEMLRETRFFFFGNVHIKRVTGLKRLAQNCVIIGDPFGFWWQDDNVAANISAVFENKYPLKFIGFITAATEGLGSGH